MATAKERLDKHDKQIAAIRSLVHEGMRLVVQTRKDIHKLSTLQIATAEAQKRTEASLQALIANLSGGGNGHNKKKIDLN